MEFDIFNPNTWHLVKDDDVFHIDGRDVYIDDFSERMKLADFVRFIEKFISVGEKQFGSFTLERKQAIIKKWLLQFYKYNTKEGRAELPPKPLPLTPETEDKTESGFMPHDESSWNLARDRRMIKVHGTRLVKDGKYVSEKQFIDEVRGIFKYISYKNPDANIQDFAKNQLEFDFSIYAEKDLEPVFTVNGFSFSKALCDCCRDIEKETLEKVADAMNFCIEQNYKKYQYKQHFFYDRIPASQEFFVEIYFAEKYKTRKNVDDLIVAFYSEFEPETREELDKILQESLYLKAHSELIPQIKARFEDYF